MSDHGPPNTTKDCVPGNTACRKDHKEGEVQQKEEKGYNLHRLGIAAIRESMEEC